MTADLLVRCGDAAVPVDSLALAGMRIAQNLLYKVRDCDAHREQYKIFLPIFWQPLQA